MDERAARPAAGSGAVIDRTSEPHPGLTPPETRWQRDFPGEDSQLRQMRHWLRSLLPDCPALDDVLTVANELATNAICHTLTGQGGWFAVEVIWSAELIRVAVADLGSASVPALSDDPAGIHGRGLAIVQALSARTGVLGDSNGREVWAEIACDAPQPGQRCCEQPLPEI